MIAPPLAVSSLPAIDDLDDARRIAHAGPRALALRRAGEALGDRLRAARAPVRRIERLPIDRFPITASAALDGALRAPLRWLAVERSALYLEVTVEDALCRVLVDPVEHGAWAHTPWGAWVSERYPRLAAGHGHPIESALRTIDVAPDTIDLVVLTHLRGQELRRLVGTSRGDGVERPRGSAFPAARWLVGDVEWACAHAPHELDKPYLVRDGLTRVDGSRLETFVSDVAIGEACALVRTPGLTDGHATLFVRTAAGVIAWTSHGVAVDCWSPYHASLPGLRDRVRELDAECVPRGDANGRCDALTSMSLERAVVDRRTDEPAFHRIVPQQELVAHPLARPTAAAPALTR
jgi:hypothetical protein